MSQTDDVLTTSRELIIHIESTHNLYDEKCLECKRLCEKLKEVLKPRAA